MSTIKKEILNECHRINSEEIGEAVRAEEEKRTIIFYCPI